MDTVDQLWLLKRIYSNENRYYDNEKGIFLFQRPSGISDHEWDTLEKAGRGPNQLFFPEHGKVLGRLCRLADTWTLAEAADAFLAGLWSAPFLWRGALTAKVIASVMPRHDHTSYRGSPHSCMICGFQARPVDTAYSWCSRMTEGTPLDGEPICHILALEEMDKIGKRPTPTEYDIWTFRAILTVIRQMPPKARYSKLRDALCKERLLPTSKKRIYTSLLESLALIGILDTEEYPGMLTQFTTYAKRDERPNVRVEVQAPLAWWDSSVGIDETALKKLFPAMDCSPVDLANRPTPIPPLAQTITGALEKKRLPHQIIPRSPDAGTGPAEAGDVYGVRIRDDVWVTVYCHRIEGKYAVVEYLDGIFSKMPSKSQLRNTIRPRQNGRWQSKASGIDRTAGVRRIARNIPPPTSDLPEPERISFSTASNLRHLAEWCFALR